MEENKITVKSIDEYILQFPPKVQEILKALRKVIKDAAPDAEEKISWQMPTFVLHGNLVHFAAHKNHIGFYPAPSGIDAFKEELSEYKGAKGSVQFPIKKPLPYELISKIVKFRVAENTKIAEDKLSKKSNLMTNNS
ncbi:iron chaperone [Anaerosolibacter sp.]|uniref:iron chaperone n=1 Tax=Anaerosolibacter sp. TaxID=1872527 RepID=UPI0039EEDA33